MREMNQLSIEAFLELKPKLTAREDWVLEAFESLGEASNETIAEHLGVGVNVTSGRITGLRNKRYIVPSRKGMNHFGRNVQYYKVARQEVLREHE